MTSIEPIRSLRRLGATVVSDRGKGGHVMVVLRGRQTLVPTGGRKDLRTRTLHKILRDLALRPDNLG
jgi:predicted RNA binding protein YcfA (HicA-like mRNA interferase family)